MQVRIWTPSFVIQGEIDTLRDQRLTDYIREHRDFIAVTSAHLQNRSTGDNSLVPFLNVSTAHIEVIYPAE